MATPLDTYLGLDALTPSERQALRDHLRENPEAGGAVAALEAAEAQLARAWDAHLPERDTLVLRALLVSGRADVLTPDERGRLDASAASLDRLFDALPSAHDVADRIVEDAALFDAVWDEAMAAAPAAPERAADRPAQPRGRTLRRAAWRVSLVFTLALLAVVGTLLFQRDRSTVTRVAAAVETVQIGEGTTVQLRPGARLRYVDAREGASPRRVVNLDAGDAYFDVATTGAPFTVETPAGRVVVTGTEFGVRATEQTTEVTLVEGRVLLAPPASEVGVTLAPGQQSRIARGALPTTPQDVDLAREMAPFGRFVFRDTPLGEVAEQLAAHYRVRIAVAPALAGERMNGTYEDAAPVASILESLVRALPGATVERTEAGGFRIR